MSNQSIYNAPQAKLRDTDNVDLYAYKKYVVCEANIEWPDRCFKCNADTSHKKTIKLAYVNPWIYLSLLITPLLTIILALIFRKKFEVEAAMCDKHLHKRKIFLIFQWSLCTFMILAFAIGIGLEMEMAFPVALISLLVLVISAIAGRLLYLAKLKNEYLWIRGAGKEFVHSLPEYER